MSTEIFILLTFFFFAKIKMSVISNSKVENIEKETPKVEVKEKENDLPQDPEQNCETYQLKPKNTRGKAKPKDPMIYVSQEQFKNISGSVDEGGNMVISNKEAKKLKPKREMSELQKANWMKVLESNKLKREAFNSVKQGREKPEKIEKSEKIIPEDRIAIKVLPKIKKPNLNHSLRPPVEPVERVEKKKDILELSQKIDSCIQKLKVPVSEVKPESMYMTLLKNKMR
jgi:hypothetical protein